ncbi:glycosyltransferase [Micromonospora yangpuensis]|uniref:Glycosyltransferase involved in cell wall bisynthesis n=1 Tax=Micromonospora yangpuensis TaxID=683228 RepID=A0A1C6UTA7_9ACTN|nr:glycosyltransferase [Micromonospora yangpuensis]GGM29204.1 glycosyl transferase [Micromonospora yangpuensis]SCL57073.1 Glycosyltransferase involved in cell wall bisynthesis [Micromonospora yangpuensis]
MSLTVLMNAGPWLSVPPPGYGGIENVVATLVPELRRLGVRVVLASVETSTLAAEERISVFPDGQFAALQRPYNQVCGIAQAHLAGVVRAVRTRDDIDLVHDHVEAVGLATLAAMGPDAPPALHTLHWDLAKHPALYGHLDGGDRVRVNGVSASQLARAPRALREHSVGHVHLATPLAVDADRRKPPAKGGYLLILGRVNPGKGQDVGARLAQRLRMPLVLAGPVGPYHRPADLAAAGDEARQNPDVRFFLDEVAPHVDGDLVRWIGTVAGQERDDLLAGARAALFPLRWEEPGGTAVVESLALGTPVVATARGCLPELVEHGRTGLLTTDEDELADLVSAAGRLDPDECRREAAARFTPAVMAQRYVELYERVRATAAAAAPPTVPTARLTGAALPRPAGGSGATVGTATGDLLPA